MTFPVPRYAIHVTRSPRGRAGPDEFTCAVTPRPPAVGGGGRGASGLGFGNPSSLTDAVSVTGTPATTFGSGANVIAGG